MFTIATFLQSCFMSWRTPAWHEVQLKQRLVLLQATQSGSAVDDEEVICQFVAVMNVKPQLEGGLQQPDSTGEREAASNWVKVG